MRLTERVHHDLKQHIHLGDTVIDATAGNGHDTLFLAQAVGKKGHVFSFDIQAQALKNTRQRVEKHPNTASVEYVHSGHEQMQAKLPLGYHGHIQAIVFNLGYLPQADHTMITTPQTTLNALQQACALLRQGGIISILAYTGHDGGREEAEAIKQWLFTLNVNFKHHIEIPQNTRLSPPEYIFIHKINSEVIHT
ncbi:MAG: class I SAM-dependent methyltransferase [Mariprofundaceae bacterium]|nr:class I SAM-dependent methyltransferase [Mariprofundaceae bacterium]